MELLATQWQLATSDQLAGRCLLALLAACFVVHSLVFFRPSTMATEDELADQANTQSVIGNIINASGISGVVSLMVMATVHFSHSSLNSVLVSFLAAAILLKVLIIVVQVREMLGPGATTRIMSSRYESCHRSRSTLFLSSSRPTRWLPRLARGRTG